MAACARLAPLLLLHLNLWLAAYGGVALATAARLKWDPSTYVALRELFPAEYRILTVVLAAAGAALLLLAHLAAAALTARPPRARRALLVAYACVTLGMVCGEAALGWWLWRRLAAWLRSREAAQLLEALELRVHVRPLLEYFGRWHPLPQHITALVDEASADAPRNGYAALALTLLLVLLQTGAAALGLVVAAARAATPHAADALLPTSRSHRREGRGALAACIHFVVKIYYSEKRACARPVSA